MQVDSKSGINPQFALANLVHEQPILPQELIIKLLKELSLVDMAKLSCVNRAWNYQVSHFAQECYSKFTHLPRWIGIKMHCGGGSLDVYQVEEEKRIPIDEILMKYLNIDEEAIYEEHVFENSRLMARCKKLNNEFNYHLFLLGHAKIENCVIQLEEISHDICGTVCYLEDCKGKKLNMIAASTNLPLITFKLNFNNVSSYHYEVGYNKTGQNNLMLRLKSVEIISVTITEKELKQVSLLFNQMIQKLNQEEDNKFFESLSEKTDSKSLEIKF